MELPIKLIDYPTCMYPPKINTTSKEEVESIIKELSEWMIVNDVKIICGNSHGIPDSK